MGRVLGAARLSHSTDASTSDERQTEQIQHTVAARGDTLVHVTHDIDISGAISPFERADLGPWLTEPEKISQWDTLMVAKLDRLTRSIADFVRLVEWCKQHGKTIVSIGDSFDLGTPVGRMVAHILALFAQFERERMAERRADHTRKAMAQARWDGRSVPPGYRPVKVADHFELEPDEAKAKRIRDMASAIIGDDGNDPISARQVGIRYGMDTAVVLHILRNQSLRGYVMHDGEPVRGGDGLPVQREEILDDETWAKLQAALDRNASPGSGSRKGGAAMLLGVGSCGTCGEPLYIQRRAAGDRYRHADGSECPSGTGKNKTPCSFTASHLHSAVESELLRHVGDVEITEKIIIPGKNNSVEIRRITESISELDRAYEAGDVTAKTYGRMQERLENRLAELEAEPGTPDQVIFRPTGQTYRQRWAELDEQGRGAFLRDAGIRLYASRDASGAARAMAAGGPVTDAEHMMRVTVVRSSRVMIGIRWGSLADLISKAAKN